MARATRMSSRDYARRAKHGRLRKDPLEFARENTLTCTSGKVRYESELDAKMALASTKRQSHGRARAKDETRYYLCPDCHGYHLTSWKTYKPKIDTKRKTSHTAPPEKTARVKGIHVFIEHLDGAWHYTISDNDSSGTAATQMDAKEQARKQAFYINPQAKVSFQYFDEDTQNIAQLYAQQCAGPEAKVSENKSSYMEPLLARVRSYLFSKGLRFRKYDKKLPGTPDIVLPKWHTVVIIDPCLWHERIYCHRKAIPPKSLVRWQAAHQKQRDADLQGRKQLEDEGWNVIVIWECTMDNRKRAKRLRGLYARITKPHTVQSAPMH